MHRWLFSRRCGGVFIEAGAGDGVINSNTLFFERHLGWKGACAPLCRESPTEPCPPSVAPVSAGR
jgi:hypothetical protein